VLVASMAELGLVPQNNKAICALVRRLLCEKRMDSTRTQ
jgi:hypothetical protein